MHSVYLDRDKCLGCTTCLRSCPTGAIRVREGKAKIIESKCIDCGECIRICPHHAKMAKTDPISKIKEYKYKVAIPAPTLLGQFELKYSIDRILSALKSLGFDEIVEVAFGAEIIGRALKYEFTAKHYGKPMISSACPAVSKLIQVRFPELTGNINRLKAPMAMTARLTRKRLIEMEGKKNEDIGIFFITPCAAKATEVANPLPSDDLFATVNGTIAIKDIYVQLRNAMKTVEVDESLHNSTAEGFSWAVSGGESRYIKNKKVLHVDGISNVIKVLEEIENGRLTDIDFFEGLACIGGCVGGCLTVENNFVAKMYLQERAKIEAMESSRHLDEAYIKTLYNTGMMHQKEKIQPRNLQPLDENMGRAIAKMQQIEALEDRLPGLDCGSCGAPGCRALAEDIVMGRAREVDCIFVLKDRIMELSKLTSDLLQVGHPMKNYEGEKEEE